MEDCIFCRIIKGEISSEFVYEDSDMIVIKDIQPKAKFHFLVIPKKHISSNNDVRATDTGLVGKMVYQAKLMAKENGFAKSGYKLLFNCGKDGGQAVSHLHLHILGGERLNGIV